MTGVVKDIAALFGDCVTKLGV